MNNQEQYCFSRESCDRVLKENASISSRGVLASLWRDYIEECRVPLNIALQGKARNVFLRCYV